MQIISSHLALAWAAFAVFVLLRLPAFGRRVLDLLRDLEDFREERRKRRGR
jgi:hypothetical protein